MADRSMEWGNVGISHKYAVNGLPVVGTCESHVPTAINWSYDKNMHKNGKFRSKYRNESARNASWDYTGVGRYFITICIHGRTPCFGDIQNGVMKLSDMGMAVDQHWAEIPDHFAHVTLDEYVIMPDHFHGIIIIGKQPCAVVGTCESHVPTQKSDRIARPAPGSVGSIIGQFKSVCTKRIWEMGHPHFRWQSRFHDHIIRNDAEFDRIRRYIIDNPKNWNKNGTR
jgi:putative transposase